MEELEELFAVKTMIETEAFQKHFARPLRERQNEIHSNFFSDTVKDAWRKGGKIEGIEEFFKILKQLDRDIKNKQFDDTGR